MPDRTPPAGTPGPVPLLRPGPARHAAEPLAWWATLLAVYLALVSAISITEITIGAVTAAAGAAAAVAGRRALLSTGTVHSAEGARDSATDPALARCPVPPVHLLPALTRLPAQIVTDTARIAVRGASGGCWTSLPVAPGPANRGVATLLVSLSPGAYVGRVDPERGMLRVHRLVPDPSPLERSLHNAGLVGDSRRSRTCGLPPAGENDR